MRPSDHPDGRCLVTTRYLLVTGVGKPSEVFERFRVLIRKDKYRYIKVIRKEKDTAKRRAEWYAAIGLDVENGPNKVTDHLERLIKLARFKIAHHELFSLEEIESMTTDAISEEVSTLSFLLDEIRSAEESEEFDIDEIALGESTQACPTSEWDKLLSWCSWVGSGTVSEFSNASTQFGVVSVDPIEGKKDPAPFLVLAQLHLLGHVNFQPVLGRWEIMQPWHFVEDNLQVDVSHGARSMQFGEVTKTVLGQPSITKPNDTSLPLSFEDVLDATSPAIEVSSLLTEVSGSVLEVTAQKKGVQWCKRKEQKGSIPVLVTPDGVMSSDLQTLKFADKWFRGELPDAIFREEEAILDVPLGFPWPWAYSRLICCYTGQAPKLAQLESDSQMKLTYRYHGVPSHLIEALRQKLEARIEWL